jgi:hypothetical protein
VEVAFLSSHRICFLGHNVHSPELETLDQLSGGDLSRTAVRTVYPNDEAFLRGLQGLLASGDVLLLTAEKNEVPSWQWEEMFRLAIVQPEMQDYSLSITPQGARRIS